jgi:YD repeat-containing protein
MNNLLDEESNCRGLFQPENANYNLSFWHLGGTETPASVQVKIQILSSDFAQVLEQQTHTMQPQSNEWKRFVRKLDLGNYLGQEVGIRVSSVDQFYLDDFLLIPTKAHYSHSGYNRKGQLTSVTDSEGDSERYYYDALGRLITTKDNNGNILTHTEYSR